MARPGATDRPLVIDYDLFENSLLKAQLSVAGLGQGVLDKKSLNSQFFISTITPLLSPRRRLYEPEASTPLLHRNMGLYLIPRGLPYVPYQKILQVI